MLRSGTTKHLPGHQSQDSSLPLVAQNDTETAIEDAGGATHLSRTLVATMTDLLSIRSGRVQTLMSSASHLILAHPTLKQE